MMQEELQNYQQHGRTNFYLFIYFRSNVPAIDGVLVDSVAKVASQKICIDGITSFSHNFAVIARI